MADSPLGEIIYLGDSQGLTVEVVVSTNGMAVFTPEEGLVTNYLYQARNPDVELNGVEVFLVAEKQGGEFTGCYAVMVDDAYWGRRIQPSRFMAPPFTETFVMGYRLAGTILHNDVPQEAANVSFEVPLETAEDQSVSFWDSEEYNRLVWSEELQTYVSGVEVTAPVTTDENGNWEYIVPKGHGAIYQRENDRRDDTPETAGQSLARYVSSVQVAYKGRMAPVAEGEPATINLVSGRVEITGTPGATLLVGVMEDAGDQYDVPPNGVVEVGGLPVGQVSIVQFHQAPTGEWNPVYGCPRVVALIQPGQTTQVTMPALEEYPDDGSVVCGRVYGQPGVPAPGIDILIINPETGEIVGTAATTNGEGFWTTPVPPEGLGGGLYIMDENWGSLPVLGMPYSDIVLGARAYCSWLDVFKTEAWRTATWGHNNFQYVPDSVWVEDNDTGTVYATAALAYGGWITELALPKWKYLSDPLQLLLSGPELRSYQLATDHGVEDPDFHLRDQSFSDWATPPGWFRAAGYYPEKKILVGGKIKYNVVIYGDDRTTEDWPEAARVGLEFGRHQPLVEIRAGYRDNLARRTCFAELICPYCGGPVQRSPGGPMPRGYCLHCAETFGIAIATDGRTFARSVTLAGSSQQRWQQRAVVLTTRGGYSNLARYQWRPDLYEETDDYLIQSSPGQQTNAPRWYAKHVHEVDDGKGLGQFDGSQSPSYVPGHDLDYFSNLVGRDLGLAQFKLAFESNYEVPVDFWVDLDCVREDDEVETLRVLIPAGTQGPNELHPLGGVIPLTRSPKLAAEGVETPYAGVGLYQAVSDIRLVEAPGPVSDCRFTVTSDVPFLADPLGLTVEPLAADFVALQLLPPQGHPHLLEDAVGQIFLFRVKAGDIQMYQRRGLTAAWEPPRMITEDGLSDYPWAGKDERGTMILVRQRGADTTVIMHSRDQGRSWEEI